VPTTLRKCDVVMEGGITSGIVYPSMVCELATRYEFKSIGGTSAGAIAATLTAAAEHARRQGDDSGFRQLAAIPSWLGAEAADGRASNLANLFQPQPGLRGLFRFATGFLTPGWGARILLWVSVLWPDLLIGCVPGALLGWLASGAAGWRLALAFTLAVLVAAVGALIAAGGGLLLRAMRLPSHHHGLCLGYVPPGSGAPPSLVGWLDERLNAIAGVAGHSLTFGDLEQAGITLRMITTCLTLGRPFTLPFETRELYFKPKEMEKFFPQHVVEWLVKNARELSAKEERDLDLTGFKALPEAENLPVIFAARLSLSFPVLFCAVPLYAVDWSRQEPAAPAAHLAGEAPARAPRMTPEVVYFSDGGICSNFPLHLFDHPLPRWPTFAVSLGAVDPGGARQDRVWMPKSNSAGLAAVWMRLGTRPGLGAVGGLLAVMFNTARNWLDNLQAAAPGYRDRIVHLALDSREGGLNLNMPPEVVSALARYGAEAGRLLIEHFCDGTDHGAPTSMTWDNHRWLRCRSTFALVERFLAEFADAIESPEPGDRSFPDLIRRPADALPKSYELTAAQRASASAFASQLTDLGKERRAGALQDGAPRPTPALRIRPSY
jgi:predicted acylesterase/phospholipase RssA